MQEVFQNDAEMLSQSQEEYDCEMISQDESENMEVENMEVVSQDENKDIEVGVHIKEEATNTIVGPKERNFGKWKETNV